MIGPSTSGRMGSLASICTPMSVQRSDPTQGTIYVEKGDTAHVQVHTLPPVTYTDTQSMGMGNVRYQESRQAMTPTVSRPATVNTNVWTEDLQPSYSTKSYETIRRDPATLFPGANIVSVGQPGVVQTALGSVFNPRDNTFYSRLTNQTALVEPLQSVTPSMPYLSPSPSTCAQVPAVGSFVNAVAVYGVPPAPAAVPHYQVSQSPIKSSTGWNTYSTSAGLTNYTGNSSPVRRVF